MVIYILGIGDFQPVLDRFLESGSYTCQVVQNEEISQDFGYKVLNPDSPSQAQGWTSYHSLEIVQMDESMGEGLDWGGSAKGKLVMQSWGPYLCSK